MRALDFMSQCLNVRLVKEVELVEKETRVSSRHRNTEDIIKNCETLRGLLTRLGAN